ncbi:MAG: hypothetical protein COX90_03260 [Candidatus Nealsonbacteria bacterium CG_4_10_14_0_2_um_filter_38_17]|uniref:Uncharacterized protein n=1 Tax=Candidatus Nealsonbacteria bacterium CG_4_10_14_0_2_um_filter_38_17 TaxID=1974680 RepID=A0A2M7UXL0_9BACT|nr:MAG: hypothetical protein COX90_03260 [Candidatus Nealsonbacteria bacterium CG_4_10_14_0_2_um_filter_38_17]
MILATHLLAGAAIATKIKNPLLALILAFFSNYLLDSLPHTEYSLKNMEKHKWRKSAFDFLKVAFDLIFGISIILFLKETKSLNDSEGFLFLLGNKVPELSEGFLFLLGNKVPELSEGFLYFSKNYILALAGAFFAILPDGFTFLFFVFPNNKLLKKHFDLHESAHIFNNKKTSNFWRLTVQTLVVLVATFFLTQ